MVDRAPSSDAIGEGASALSRWRQTDLLDIPTLLVAIRRRLLLILIGTAVVTSAAAVYLIRGVPMYRAVAVVIVDDVSHLAEIDERPGKNRYTERVDLRTQMRIARSEAVLRLAALRLGGALADSEEALNGLVAQLRQNVSVTEYRDTRVLEFEARAADGETAAAWANAMAEAYASRALEVKQEANKGAFEWLTVQLELQQRKARASEEELLRYRADKDILSLTKKQELLEETLASLQAQRIQASRERDKTELVLKELDHAAEAGWNADALPSLAMTATLEDLLKRRNGLVATLSEESSRFGPKYPTIVALNKQLTDVQGLLAAEAEAVRLQKKADLRIQRGIEESIGLKIKQTTGVAQRLAADAVEYRVLERDAEGDAAIYSVLLDRLKEADISGNVTLSNARVVDAAVPPRSRDLSYTLRGIVFVLLASGSVFVLLSIVVDAADARVRSDDVGPFFKNPVLGRVPWSKSKLSDVENMPVELLAAYDDIRVALQFQRQSDDVRSVVLTSALASEGKTTCALGVSRSLAESGQRVLLCDADAFNGRLTSTLGATDGPGLTEYVNGEASRDEIVCADIIPGLDLVRAGAVQENPSLVVGSDRAGELIKAAKEDYDWVVVDAPPVVATLDVAALSRFADGVLFLMSLDKTPRALARRSLKSLADLGVGVLGLVLMNVTRSRREQTYYHPYYRARGRSD